MNENNKTFIFVGAALSMLGLAIWMHPAPPRVMPDNMVGKSLFPEMNDPLKAKRMKIISFDEDTARGKEFEVAQAEGVWSLPSHGNYPADAKDQMAQAVAALFDMKVLGVVGNDTAQDHEEFGVIEPDRTKNLVGQRGIGKMVVVEDGSGKALAKLIIGKEDKSNAPQDDFHSPQSKLRFVRVPGQDRVYRVSMKSDKFSTKFNDWIETDLLKISPFDIKSVELRDYSVNEAVTPDGRVAQMLNQRATIDVAYNDQDGKWTLEKLVEYKNKKPEEVKLTDDEELNTAKLNELKTALDDLKIINVAKKPERMTANLKAEKDFLNDREALVDLQRRGFLPVPVGENQVDIVSNDGETIVSMKDGVEYVLRFGDIAGIDSAEKSDDAKGDEKAGGEKKPVDENKLGLSRYIMVMAQFNPELLPKPMLEPLPEIKPAEEKKEPAAEKKDKANDANSEVKSDAKDAKADAKDAKEDAKADAKDAKSDTKSDEQSDAKDAPKEGPKADDDADREAQDAERARIERENARKQAEYDEKVKEGQKKAKDLNDRFAGWYYVVDNATYQKIHLGKNDVIQKKTADKPADEADPPPFNIPGLPGK